MQADAVAKSYRRWAPVYDTVFGKVFDPGRSRITEFANRMGGRVLEVGVGTGLALPKYHRHLEVVGIDFSAEMLAKAIERRDQLGLDHISLLQMDAQNMDFADASFDTIAAAHVLSVVPAPEQALAEMVRICRPGGHILISNHFSATEGPMKWIERSLQPLQNHLGWRADFAIERVLAHPELTVIERKVMPPIGMMTWLSLRKH